MGFEEHEKMDLFKNCSSIMHMGEMKFKQRPREEQAESDGTEGGSVGRGTTGGQMNMKEILQKRSWRRKCGESLGRNS